MRKDNPKRRQRALQPGCSLEKWSSPDCIVDPRALVRNDLAVLAEPASGRLRGLRADQSSTISGKIDATRLRFADETEV